MNSLFPAEGAYQHNVYGWTAKTTDIGTSVRQIPHIFNVSMLEDKTQNPGKCLFWFSLGGKCCGSKK